MTDIGTMSAETSSCDGKVYHRENRKYRGGAKTARPQERCVIDARIMDKELNGVLYGPEMKR